MEEQLKNEVLLIGKMISGLYKIQANNKKAYRVIMKVQNEGINNNIPVIFINPEESHLKKCRNKELSISGHIETKWGMRIIVDAYKIEDDEDIQMMVA